MLKTVREINGPAFQANQNASVSVPTGTFTALPINNEVYDTNSNFDPVTYRLTPTTPGYYQIDAVANYFPDSGGNAFISIFKNGAEYIRGPAVTASTFFGLVASALVPMNGTTDYIDVRIFQGAAPQTYNPGPGLCTLSGSFARPL